ncbi:hypothetical protein LEP1GSC021_1573 [Leptospira noguchii str. 1993005606]|nr:hypothetical protein LEP1GSC021_1573 [Leptospira noguchii str. 1993005606]
MELLQITVLQTNFKIVGTHTFRKFFFIFLRPARVVKGFVKIKKDSFYRT